MIILPSHTRWHLGEKQKHIKNMIFAFGLFLPGANLYMTLGVFVCVWRQFLLLTPSPQGTNG